MGGTFLAQHGMHIVNWNINGNLAEDISLLWNSTYSPTPRTRLIFIVRWHRQFSGALNSTFSSNINYNWQFCMWHCAWEEHVVPVFVLKTGICLFQGVLVKGMWSKNKPVPSVQWPSIRSEGHQFLQHAHVHAHELHRIRQKQTKLDLSFPNREDWIDNFYLYDCVLHTKY